MPGPAQLAFHQARDEVAERGLLAGTGAGKTYAAGFEALDITFRERGAVGVIGAPDFPQLEVSVYPTLERLLGLGQGERPRLADGGLEPYGVFNQSKKRIDWWNGWTWRFASMDTPQSVEGIPDAAFVWLNEARLVPDFDGDDGPWNNLTRRLRGEDDRPRRAWFDTHSPTPGIVRAFKPATVRTVTVDGSHFEVAHCMDPDRMTFQWSTAAAIKWRTLAGEAGSRILRRYHGEAAKRILEGRYARQEGLVYSDFSEERNLKAMPGELKPERLSAGIDWGWDVTAIQLLAWTGSRKWSIAEENLEHASLAQIAKALHAMRRAYGDFTAWGGADRPDSASELCQILEDGVGLDVRPVKPSKVMDGVGLLQTDLRQGEWLVDPSLKWLRQDLDNYAMDREKGEPDKDAYDAHHLDAVRYAAMGERRLVRGGTW